VNSPEDETDVVETSLEDDLRAAFAEANSTTVDNDTGAVVDDAGAGADASETEEAKATRERDEHGRFKPKEASAEAEPKPASDTASAEEPGQITPDPYGLAPQYAGPAIKAKWASLDPEVRAEIVKRDQEVHRTFTRFDEERNFGKQVKDVVAPYEGFIKSLGGTPVQAFDYLIKTDYALRTAQPEQRKALFLKAAADYGIDLSGAQQPQEHQPQIDPQIETLQQRIARLESEQNNAIAARREQDQQQIDAQIADFASKPENVYFERVKPVMATLLQSGQADSLDKAYDMAVYADPETRALHLAAQREAEDRKRTAERTQQAQRARQASPSVTGAPGSTMPAHLLNGAQNASVEDDLREAFRAHAGRA
jgi:hypothetical protein